MDEGTAALDQEAEAAIFDALRQLGGNKTLILVTHHQELAQRCDIIYLIDERSKNVRRIK